MASKQELEALGIESNNIIICGNCYEENQKGAKCCYNCGRPLYYNDSKELDVIDLENDIIYPDNNKFEKFIKYSDYIMGVDTENKEICFFYKLKLDKVIKFQNIVECKILEDKNNATINFVENSLLLGTYTIGTTREIVTSLELQIITKDTNNSLYIVNLINKKTEKYKKKYKEAVQFAKEMYSLILSITSTSNNKTSQKEDFINQIEKLAELKDKGIITPEEFEETKKKILNKM